MPNYVLTYHGGRTPMSPEESKKHMGKFKAWVAWLGDAAVNPGTPVGQSKSISSTGITDGGGSNPMSGFSIVKADDMKAAIKIVRACPHLNLQNATIVISEVMEMN